VSLAVKSWLLPELDHEMALTRDVLTRLPEAALAWKPHERSFSLGALAAHLAVLPKWGLSILEHDAYDLDAGGASPAADPPSAASVLESFDRHASALRRALVERAEVELDARWSLLRGSRVLMTMPRHAALRRFLLNHTVHHRGQMTVYLRLQNTPVPPMYGSSADERL
jgi:uncharacterized damage-inducible protein DinB